MKPIRQYTNDVKFSYWNYGFRHEYVCYGMYSDYDNFCVEEEKEEKKRAAMQRFRAQTVHPAVMFFPKLLIFIPFPVNLRHAMRKETVDCSSSSASNYDYASQSFMSVFCGQS
jgi:hypothetical protein